MTIKDFSLLCGCIPQTLRYYDGVGLLKPARVDKESGYRHYDKKQAADFVKIKNLQRAGFTIDEIKKLLDKDDRTICAAFDEKIAEAKARLSKIQAIQDSYRTEMDEIMKKIEKIKATIAQDMHGYDPTEEFGITAEQYESIIANTLSVLDNVDPSQIKELDYKTYSEGDAPPAEEPVPDCLNDPDFELIFEKRGYKAAQEFMDELPPLAEGGDYSFLIYVNKKKYPSSLPFMNTLLAIVLSKSSDKKLNLNCELKLSKDGENHLWLLKKRTK